MLLAAVFVAGCQSKQPATPANTPTPLVSSCLGDFRMDDLKLMVERCDKAIEQTQDQADLHRDRALVLTLLGNQAKACEDVELALSLLKQSSLQLALDLLLQPLPMLLLLVSGTSVRCPRAS